MAKMVSVPIMVCLGTESECRRPPKLLFHLITLAAQVRAQVKIDWTGKWASASDIQSYAWMKGGRRGSGQCGSLRGLQSSYPHYPYLHHTSIVPLPYLQHTSTVPPPYLYHTPTIPSPYLHHTSTISKRTKLIQYFIKLYRTVQYHTCNSVEGGLRSFARLQRPSGSPVIKTNLHLPMQIPGSHCHHHHLPHHHSE